MRARCLLLFYAQVGAPAVRVVHAGRSVRGHGGPALDLARLYPALALVIKGVFVCLRA